MDDAELRAALQTAETLRRVGGIVHTFAAKWTGPHKGPRGGTYWLREGAQDIEANRVYGAQPGEMESTSVMGKVMKGVRTVGKAAIGLPAVGAMGGFALGGPVGAAIGGLIGAGADYLLPDPKPKRR